MIPARFWILTASALLCAACQKAGSNPSTETKDPTAQQPVPGPREIATKSGVQMVFVPAGEFVMGDDRGNSDEAPAHKVKISAFLMDKFEVTHGMFAEAQLPDASHRQDNPDKQVERVRWRDAKRYCNERSLLEGLTPCYNEKTVDWDCDYIASGYRLPTEAEWEYACRAGTDRPYDFGSSDKLRQYAWFSDNAEQKTHLVGQKKPNNLGICDLYGNVSEWCEDVYSPNYYRIARPSIREVHPIPARTLNA